MKGNDFVAWLLRSPLHRLLSGNTLLITVRGRKTGKEITLPVNFIRIGSELWVVSSRERTWWRNLRGGAPVGLWLQGEPVAAQAEAVLEQAQVAERLGEYVRRIPLAAKSLGIRIVNGTPATTDLMRVADERVMVRIDLPDIDKTGIRG